LIEINVFILTPLIAMFVCGEKLKFCKAGLREGCMTITKADMVKIICEKMGFASKESTDIVDQVFGILKESLEGGEKIKISGFGNFVVRQKRPRKGRNPQTGEEMVISGRRIVTFKPSLVLRKALNQEVLSSELSGATQERFNEAEDL
jgi:integration host factor subunit alpha